LTSVTIPGSVTSIDFGAFSGCSRLTNVAILCSVSSLSRLAFYGCRNLSWIDVNASNPSFSSVGGVMFDKSQTTLIHYPMGRAGISYAIPGSVTSIGDYAFFDCTSLTSVTIPSSVTSIGDSAFAGCTSLTSVTFPNSVTIIGRIAFSDCTSLTGAYFKGNSPRLEDKVFSDDADVFARADNATIYHRTGTTDWTNTFGGRPTAIWNPQTNATTNAQSK
ncbi:MAG: leucine-rich repeat domain-containing protein, partial [bacterium]